MKVELFNRTTWALETLIYTKDTRLQAQQTFDDICEWPEEKKIEHLSYMKDTIQSSWEFIDYHFKISGVTRAFTHQLVRTRTASFAQESQRTIDASNHEVINTCEEDTEHYNFFDTAAAINMIAYSGMIENGMPIQDARGILPTNVSTSIIVKANLRTLHDMALLRLCTRTQGEYQRVFKAMIAEVFEVHPWTAQFIQVHCAWYGSCAFPRYTECPVKWEDSDREDAARKFMYEQKWNQMTHEANPVAKEGMTQ